MRNPWEIREFNSWKKKCFESEVGKEIRIKAHIKNKPKLKQQIKKSVQQSRTKTYHQQLLILKRKKGSEGMRDASTKNCDKWSKSHSSLVLRWTPLRKYTMTKPDMGEEMDVNNNG